MCEKEAGHETNIDYRILLICCHQATQTARKTTFLPLVMSKFINAEKKIHACAVHGYHRNLETLTNSNSVQLSSMRMARPIATVNCLRVYTLCDQK